MYATSHTKNFHLKDFYLYTDLPRDHPESYHYFMWHNFFKHIDIQPCNVHILNGNASNLDAECEDYEKKILEAGGIHLFIGGLIYIFHLISTYERIIYEVFLPRHRSGWTHSIQRTWIIISFEDQS